MTNTEIIQAIKTEIERRLKDYWKICFHDVKAYNEDSNIRELKELLSFISTLEESEKPVPTDLEEAAVDIADNLLAKPKDYALSAKADYWNGVYDGVIAGAQWQEKKNQETIKLAEDHAFLAGADWQREQMMKNALHGWLDEDNESPYDLNVVCEDKIPFGEFKHCDKVRIIIVKEEN